MSSWQPKIYNFLDYPAGVVPVTTVTAADCTGSYEPGTDDAGLADAMQRSRVGSEGLPVAVQVVARPWEEEVALRVMAAVESPVAARHQQHHKLTPTPRRTVELGGTPLPI